MDLRCRPDFAAARGGDAPPLYTITEDAQSAPAPFPKLFVIFKCCCVYLDYSI